MDDEIKGACSTCRHSYMIERHGETIHKVPYVPGKGTGAGYCGISSVSFIPRKTPPDMTLPPNKCWETKSA